MKRYFLSYRSFSSTVGGSLSRDFTSTISWSHGFWPRPWVDARRATPGPRVHSRCTRRCSRWDPQATLPEVAPSRTALIRRGVHNRGGAEEHRQSRDRTTPVEQGG